MQLRSVMNIPTDSTLPVDVYHSSIRDYVSDPQTAALLKYTISHHPTPYSLFLLCA